MNQSTRSYSNDSFLARYAAAADAAPPVFTISKIGRRRFLQLTGVAGGGLLLGVATTIGSRSVYATSRGTARSHRMRT